MESTNSYIETDLGNVSPNPRGTYDNDTSYEYLDLVDYQGGSYICTVELGTTISGTAPEAGKNTDHWQLLTLPGDTTPEYIAAHDAVVEKAKQVEASRAAVELSQTEIEAMRADVTQMHQDTRVAAQEAQESKEAASGYAQEAEVSRLAAAEAEQNATAQVQGFDAHVSAKKTETEQAIVQKRQEAVNVVQAQGETSKKEVSDIADKVTNATSEAKEAASTATAAANSAATSASTATAAANSAKTAQTNVSNQVSEAQKIKSQFDTDSTKALADLDSKRKEALADVEEAETEVRSEIEDARTDRKGMKYETLGEAIRGQLIEIGLYLDEDGDLCQVDEEEKIDGKNF